MKNESTTITQRRGNHGNHLAMLQHRQSSRIFMEKNSYCVFGGISLVSCVMSCSNQTRLLLGLSIEHNWWDWAEHSRKNVPTTTPRHDKIILLIMLDHMLRRRSKPTLKHSKVLPHLPYSPDIAPSDYHLFRLMTHGLSEQHFTSYQKLYWWLDSLKRWSVLLMQYPHARKMGKSSGDGHYFE